MRVLHVSAQKPDSTGSGVYMTEVMAALARSNSAMSESAGAEGACVPFGESAAPRSRHSQNGRERIGETQVTPDRGEAPVGVEQAAIFGISSSDAAPAFPAGIRSYPVLFDTEELPFPVVGMSNEMPYPSTRYPDLTPEMRDRLLAAFEARVRRALSEFAPDVVFCHHLYLVTAQVIRTIRESGHDCRVIALSHSTDLRQFRSIPETREFVRAGVRMADELCALHAHQAREISELFGVDEARIRVVGSGYQRSIFNLGTGAAPRERAFAYAGKIGFKKGVNELVGAFEAVTGRLQTAVNDSLRGIVRGKAEGAPCLGDLGPSNRAYPKSERLSSEPTGAQAEETVHDRSGACVLRLAGGHSTDSEFERICERIDSARSRGARIELLGKLGQVELAESFRTARVFVLPSYFEGLPLVAIEALACGCRVVMNDLPGLGEWFREFVPNAPVRFVEPPRIRNVDEPDPEDLPAYEDRLARAMLQELEAAEHDPVGSEPPSWMQEVEALSWDALACRIFEERHG